MSMKKLTDKDIDDMIATECVLENDAVCRDVRRELHLSARIPAVDNTVPKYAKLDLHQLTEEQAWAEIMNLAKSGVRNATIITGASGILRVKFIQWAGDSVLSPYINSFTPINNGSFDVKFNKIKVTF